MKRILTVSILLTLIVSFGVSARSPRWNALGGEHRFIIDDTNYSAYPGRVTMFGNELFVMPVSNFLDNDFTGGVLLNVKENMTLAFHYNLASTGANNLRNALAGLDRGEKALSDAERDLRNEEEGTPEWYKARKAVAGVNQSNRLAALDIKPFPDLFWGMKMGNISLGARLALAFGSSSDAASTLVEPIKSETSEVIVARETKVAEEITTSANALDMSLGATVYETPAGDLDLGLSVGLQSFSGDDPNNDARIESTGGLDIAFDARLNKPLGENGTLVPLASLNMGTVPSAEYDEVTAPDVTEVSYMNGDIGVGFRKKTKSNATLITGVVFSYNATSYEPSITIENEENGEVTLEKKEILKTTDTVYSSTVLAGYERIITDWLMARGGVGARFAANTDELLVEEKTEDFRENTEDVTEVVAQKSSTSVDYYYNMGLRTMFRGLVMDIILARNIVHRGPYFLTGGTGNWATEVCVTYKF